MKLRFLIPISLVIALIFSACQPNITFPTGGTGSGGTTGGSTLVRLRYSDSIYFLRNQLANYTVLPTSKPNQSGYFKAIPRGLVIDSLTGRINISQSESGIRYKIFYVGQNGLAIDSAKLVVSGIDYQDAIYEIARTPNAYDTAFPVYNARPSLALPCPSDDDDDDDSGCIFDETDLNNDGNDDIAGVIQDKLLVDKKKGTIDLEASYHAGIFGSSNPVNGLFKDFTFYYRLQDASSMALNKISVRVYHYRTRADIPASLLATMQLNQSVANNVNLRSIASIEEYTQPRRPPIIVIVSQ